MTALAALLLLFYKPWFIYDVGFLLTFGAVFAIAFVFLPLDKRIFSPLVMSLKNVFSTKIDLKDDDIHKKSRMLRFSFEKFHFYFLFWLGREWFKKLILLAGSATAWVGRIILVTFAVMVFTIPIMSVFHFPVTFGGLFATVPAMIILVPVLLIAIFAVPFSVLWPTLCSVLLNCAAYLVVILDRVAFIARGSPHWINPFAPVGLICYLMLLYLIVCFSRSTIKVLIIMVIFFALAFVINFSESIPEPVLKVLDVGEGDAILLSLPHGRNLLVDTGGLTFVGRDRGDLSRRLLIPVLVSSGIMHLDALYLTHFDFDHCGSAIGLIKWFDVKKVYCSAAELKRAPPIALEILRASLDRKIPLIPVEEGDRQKIGGFEINVLSPPQKFSSNKSNKNCLVLYLNINNHSLLLTGDIDKEVEAKLISRYPKLKVELLKCAHHGSLTSTSELFLRAIRPRCVLISSGEPWRFSHPSPIVLNRLEEKSILYYTTWRVGEIDVYFEKKRPLIDTPFTSHGMISNILHLYSY